MIYKLSDLCDYVKEKIDVKELTPKNYISTENMLPNKRGISIASSIPSILQTQAFKKGDILISNIRPYFKKIWYAEYDGGCSNDVLVLRAKKGVNKQYLYYLLADDRFFDYAMAFSKGTKMPRGDKTAIMNYSVISFSNEKQDNIAEILNVLDKKIFINDKINRNLSEQAFALFKEMFPNVNQGEHTLGEYLSAVKGKALLSKDAVEGDVPVIAGGLSPATYHNVANTKAPVLTISASGANAGYVALWNVDVWSSDSSYIDSNMTENVYFWYVMLKTRQKEIFDAHTGSVQPHIYPKNIDDLSVAELDRKIVTDYTMQVSPLFELIGKNIKENERLIILRDSLLPKLMSGDLNVSNLYI